MEQNQYEVLFYVDTEFAGDVLIELGIENAAGMQVVSSVVKHDKGWRQNYDKDHIGTRLLMQIQKKRFGWNDDCNMPSGTKTINTQEFTSILLEAQNYA